MAAPLGLALGLAGVAANAEPVDFADDFSAESLRFTLDRRPTDRATRTYDVLDDRVVMAVSATTDENQGEAQLNVWGRSDSVTARVSLDELELPVDRGADARVRIAGQFWNDTADGGTDGRVGDVYVQLRLRARGDGSREASLCVDRDTQPDGGGNEGVPLFEDGNNCDRFPDFVPELGVEYTLSVAVDRAAGTLTYAVDDMVRTVSLGQPVFVPASDNRRVEVLQEGVPGRAVGSVYAIGTDDFFQDFATDPPAIGPYRPFFDLERPGTSLSVVDGRARFETVSTPEEQGRINLRPQGESDRIEAVLELSSESTFVAGPEGDTEPTARHYLGFTSYNDTAEGGFNENEGNVFAAIELNRYAEGAPRIEYCLVRSNTADFSDTLDLLAEGDRDCTDSGIDAALDTEYAASLELDREAGTLRFTVDDAELVYPIATPIFAVEDGRFFIGTGPRAFNGSTAISYIDDYRTSADAPLVSGAVAPTGTGGQPDAQTPDATAPDTAGDVATDATADAEDASDGSDGGGGCSIGGRGGDGVTWLLGLLAAAGLMARRRRADAR